MTLPHTRLGDKGQQFEVQAFGYPAPDKWNVIGWSEAEASAWFMAEGIRKAPSCTNVRVIDRFGAKYHVGSHSITACKADSDDHCDWEHCPQLRDNEPHKSGRHCPLDRSSEE